jgi:hypothetical protein
MFWHENIQIVQLHWLHLQYQSVLGEDRKFLAQQLTAAQATVMELPAAVKVHHHKLHMNNFFYSPHLHDDLKKKRIYCCGTVVADSKGMPKDLGHQKIKLKGVTFEKRPGVT